MDFKNSDEHPKQQVAPPLAAAAEACKSFDESKEQINKEFEEEKSELQPKVLETYEASLEEIKVFENDGDGWKAKVLPKTAKAAAAEACKSFDESKTLVKEPKEAGLKKHFLPVHEFLEELVKIEFPGSKPVSEASSKYGPASVSGPIFFVFEKVSTFIVTEEKVEPPPEAIVD